MIYSDKGCDFMKNDINNGNKPILSNNDNMDNNVVKMLDAPIMQKI